MEDMLYEVESVRRFVGLRLPGPLPDETTILNFRHLLEEHELGSGLFEEINRYLESKGLRLQEGTIVDASIIAAPSSTKNRAKERDPEMHQTKKGNVWHFGMKVHIGVDSQTGVVHSMTTTSANMHDLTELPRLLHGGESQVWGDAGYQGVDKRPGNRGLDVEWQVAMRPGQRRKLEPESPEAVSEKRKASVRAKVEHPFPVHQAALRLRQGPLQGTVQEHAAADDAAGVCQLDEGRPVPGGVKPCISAPKIRPNGGETPCQGRL